MKTHDVIVGIDEAGRGALAGPVTAGACVLPEKLPCTEGRIRRWRTRDGSLVADSKILSPEEREKAYAWITAHCIYGIGIIGTSEIDAQGILACTERAMHAALAMVEEKVKPTYLLIDGRDHFWFPYPKSGVVRGDSLEAEIAAASIIAKVTRDRIMREKAREFPHYGFDAHKGYGSEEHIQALKKHGTCPLHRRTFLTRILPEAALTSLTRRRP